MNLNKLLFKYGIYYPVVLVKTQGFFLAKNRLMRSQYWNSEAITQLQLKKLRALLNSVKRFNPYYRDTLSKVDSSSITSLESLKKIPFIDKHLVKIRHKDFLPAKIPPFCTKKTTGGSTGQPVSLLKSRRAMAYELAATWRGYSWAGIDIGDRQARFWGVPFTGKKSMMPQLIDFVCNRLRLSAFSFTDESLERYRRSIQSFKPVYYYGYVSMIEAYAKYLRRKKVDTDQDLKAVITTSEVLHPSQRKFLQKILGAKVYNEYGCGEVGSVAHECEHGNMHICAENMIVEILDGDRICRPGEIGEIVVTELNNDVFPLIRYRLGDFATITDRPCPCGRNLPILEEIKGRAYDIITTDDGRKFHGEFFMYIFEEVERMNCGVAKFQVRQLAINEISVKIVPSSTFRRAEVEKMVTGYAKKHLGEKVSLTYEIVEEIPREKSGKMRIIVGME